MFSGNPACCLGKRVFQNVALGIRNKRHREEKTELMLEKVGLDQYKDAWPGFSPGQCNWVALARALGPAAPSRPLFFADVTLGRVSWMLSPGSKCKN